MGNDSSSDERNGYDCKYCGGYVGIGERRKTPAIYGYAHDSCMASAKQAELDRIERAHKAELRAAENRHKDQMRQSYRQQLLTLQSQLHDKSVEYNETHGQLVKLQQQVDEEEASINSDFSEERENSSTKIIILLGITGDGKSTFGNRLVGDASKMGNEGPFKTSAKCSSCTQHLFKYQTTTNGHKISVVDTPGWNDSDGNDRTHANNLCAYLRGCGGINQFVLVRNATNYRFDNNIKRMLKSYEVMFGKSFWTHLAVVLTRVEKGFSESQFKEAGKDEDMKNYIFREFGLNESEVDLPVIPVGLDNYLNAIDRLLKCLRKDRFECNSIKSPLEELKTKRSELLTKDQRAYQRVNTLKQQIQSIQKQINSL